MSSLSDRIMKYAGTFPEGQPFGPKNFLHLGNRAAVDQALGRLTRQERMMRIFQGIYVRTLETSSGRRAPDVRKVLDVLSRLWSQPMVSSDVDAARSLGLTDQVPPRPTYLTSGPDRRLSFGDLEVDLRHVPPWQLVAPGRLSGTIIRALAFVGPEEAENTLNLIVPDLSEADRADLLSMRSRVPLWIAEPLSVFMKLG